MGEAPVSVTHSVKAAPTRPISSITPAYYGAADPAPQAATTQSITPVVAATYATAPVVAATYTATPVSVSAPAPVVVASSPTVEGSQFHAQDDIGQYNYGYSDGNSVKQEIKTADGVVRGAYSYIDADGLTQTVN